MKLKIMLAIVSVAIGSSLTMVGGTLPVCHNYSAGSCPTDCYTIDATGCDPNASCQVEPCTTLGGGCTVSGTSEGCTFWPCEDGQQSSNCPCSPC